MCRRGSFVVKRCQDSAENGESSRVAKRCSILFADLWCYWVPRYVLDRQVLGCVKGSSSGKMTSLFWSSSCPKGRPPCPRGLAISLALLLHGVTIRSTSPSPTDGLPPGETLALDRLYWSKSHPHREDSHGRACYTSWVLDGCKPSESRCTASWHSSVDI